MSNVTATALSGMKAAQSSLGASAHNIANLSTPGFTRQQVMLAAVEGGGVVVSLSSASQPGAAPEADVVAQMAASHHFVANLQVLRTSDRMTGALLDATA